MGKWQQVQPNCSSHTRKTEKLKISSHVWLWILAAYCWRIYWHRPNSCVLSALFFKVSLCAILKLQVPLWNTALTSGCMLWGAETKPVAGTLWAGTVYLQAWSKSHPCVLLAECRREFPCHGRGSWAPGLIRAVTKGQHTCALQPLCIWCAN